MIEVLPGPESGAIEVPWSLIERHRLSTVEDALRIWGVSVGKGRTPLPSRTGAMLCVRLSGRALWRSLVA